VVEGRGRDKVEGRFNPGKDVRRILTVDKAMVGLWMNLTAADVILLPRLRKSNVALE
jgi:hypothetical protein